MNPYFDMGSSGSIGALTTDSAALRTILPSELSIAAFSPSKYMSVFLRSKK